MTGSWKSELIWYLNFRFHWKKIQTKAESILLWFEKISNENENSNIKWAQIFMIRSSKNINFIFYILELIYTCQKT